ncbi:tRNA-splicing endonuclease subunit Sen34 isoform X1 [Oreochromis niloticus]|uniref:tRNA-splicing endonuclease subunit Sen34 isoform X1 n=1 Tax=Oreochromis niloticus TaxID=8128 RepID=UPI0003940D83|nr:tRNA-splicing endonuclease subunit Sen34 isoform X1 [Oreochromis niloticus]XP_005462791.1 tRNA-splicing endonuclease subunit Sen34 isoform X1 [Oreochromis niloticus]XP_005462793.1 tRNA-splicing endonuclease subunit Sen34 isoform X1 [Oreochromis niloticus]XP_025753848.1 tRNA-splicing endonuclease subunit Sen34 isoform X1 [Oreochromis niloticus]
MEALSCGEQRLGSEEEEAAPAVGVSLCDSAPLVWRMQDLRAVRARGLVGVLLGSLPRTPRQNGRLGRPLLLLPEEEGLLMERRAAAALPDRCQQDGGGAELRQQYEEEEQRSFEEQSVLALEDRKSALLRAMTGAESGAASADEALQRRLQALDQNFTFPQSAMAVQLSTARAGLSYCPEARAFLQAYGPTGAEPRCDIRYQVFRDLRGRGFYLTSAGKFGGDFLVYPGDPLRFHAHFIAVCVSLDESVCLLDVLAVARLGSNVKKTVLLCSPGPDASVCYTSLQWSGIV